ncbi:CAMK family protein kinase [Tritrichomonas foetus]|uniref:CAMK family protein kinase n=1 Tax=Tritrichomonas foetus TaxID=1144522 RepID=A0A1J4JJT9_9EUKA|nr:CAMK family protein kinase [Tritrichomonas foetus]|eukprot:OHS99424.1 CAMK family protein kinase [Tritrichomonas foetus]
MAILMAGEHIREYILIKCIGEGSSGRVWKAKNSKTNHKVALKILDKSKVNTILYVTERDALNELDHSNIVQLKDSFDTKRYLVLVEELIKGMSLLEYVNYYGPLDESKCRKVFSQLIEAVQYIQNHNYLHRDLKAENLLIDTQNLHLTVIDFGFAVSTSNHFVAPSGSPAYLAPEIVKGLPIDGKIGIWSCGIILYAMAAGSLPFYDENTDALFNQIIYAEPEYPLKMNIKIANLVSKMLEKNPLKRITLDMIKKHPFLNNSIENRKFLSISPIRRHAYITAHTTFA